MTRVRQATTFLFSRGKIIGGQQKQCTAAAADYWRQSSSVSAIPPSYSTHDVVITRSLYTPSRIWTPLTAAAKGSNINNCSNMIVRGFAIKRKKGKGRAQNQNTEPLPLMNERLVKAIMDRSPGSSPDKVKLRLVVEKDSQSPTTSEETTVASAIQTSLDLGLDLVVIDLNGHDLPVVRAVDYEGKLYRVNKQKAAKAKNNKDLDVKEFRFRARVADHDFQRKIERVVEALEKGHKCTVSATCPNRMILNQQIPLGAETVMERILDEVEATGVVQNPPTVNKEKTHATVMLIPKKT